MEEAARVVARKVEEMKVGRGVATYELRFKTQVHAPDVTVPDPGYS